MRKVYVDVMVRFIICVDEGVSIDEVLDEMDYNFKSCTDTADIEDATITDWIITDSK